MTNNAGGKNSADRSLLVDLMYWVSQNPPPAHLFLISGDRDFSGILHRLRMNNYNILLASTDTAPGVLCSASSIMWNWNAIVKGENLVGRHFNQPPEGPYGSWYGHYKGPLEDPFSVCENSSSRIEEFSESESKIRPVPKVVTKQIQSILNSNPKGMPIIELHSELKKSNIGVDKDFYGYKKFSCFLFSMPHILRLQTGISGNYIVRGVTSKSLGPSVKRDQDLDSMVGSKSNNQDGKTRLPPQNDVNVEKPSKKPQQISAAHDKVVNVDVKQSPDKLQLPSPIGEKIVEQASKKPQQISATNEKVLDVDVKQSPDKLQLPSPIGEKIVEQASKKPQQISATNEKVLDVDVKQSPDKLQQPPPKVVKVVSPQVTDRDLAPVVKQSKIWKKWLYGDGSGFHSTNHDTSGKNGDSENDSEKKNSSKAIKFERTLDIQDTDPVCQKTDANSEVYIDESSRPGLFNRIVSWCKFWKGSPDPDTQSDESCKSFDHLSSRSEISAVLTQDSFWTEIETFIGTSRASALISNSKTRQQMAESLQKEGPSILKSLTNDELLQLMDLLITDKKWVKECPSLKSPFSITQKVPENSSPRPSSPSKLQKSPENGERQAQNITHTVNKNKPSEKSRSEMLIDCQKLVNETLMKNPEGYNIGTFKNLFLVKYGYVLDHQKLGYNKYISLFQIMHGVKVENNYIFPAGTNSKISSLDINVPSNQQKGTSLALASSDGELSDESKKNHDSDSPWDELGPVSKIPETNTRELGTQSYPDYETPISDDEFTDSEGETKPERRQKAKGDGEDSSLMLILDSWYDKKDCLRGKSECVDSSSRKSKVSDLFGAGSKNEASLVKPRMKERSQKYNFVSENVEDDKSKLIDGMIGNLKKTTGGESRMPN
ncbi:hypothetical protein ACFE04_019101 [Oxalis oulophora]